MKIKLPPPSDINNPKPVNEQGKVLSTDDVELMMNLIDLLFMGQEKDDIIPS